MMYVIKHYLVGGDEIWWREDRNGYTDELVAAGLYSEEEARAIEKLRPPKDRAIPLTEALSGLGTGTVGSFFNMRAYRGTP